MNDKVTRPLTAIEAHDYESNAGTALPGHAGTELAGHAGDTPKNYLKNPHTRKPTTLRDITGNSDITKTFDFRVQVVAGPGQTVFLMRNNRVVQETVRCIRTHITESKRAVVGFDLKIELSINDEEGDPVWVSQDSCFAFKEALLVSL